MQNKINVNSKQGKKENKKVKEVKDMKNKATKKRKIKPLIGNIKMIFKTPLISETINNRNKGNQYITNKCINIKEEHFSIKLQKNIYSPKKINSVNENNKIFSERKTKKNSKEDINLKNLTFSNVKKRRHYAILNGNIHLNQICSKNIKILKNSINQPENGINTGYNNYTTKNSIKKSRARTLFIKNNYQFLNSTDYSSSITKNTFLINKKNKTRENSISNHNNTILSEINKMNKTKNNLSNKKIDINKYFKLKEIKNKRCYNSSKNSHRNIINFKEYHYKHLKKYNDLLKKLNSIGHKNNKHYIINRNKSSNKNKTTINNYSSIPNKNKIYKKLPYTSRKQSKLKKLVFNHKDHSLDKKPEINTNLNNTNNYECENKETIKIKILIKSNWGNSTKIDFIKISFIDTLNEKILIKKANYDIDKAYIDKYNKGETKILVFYYDIRKKIKNIEIINGFDDSGIKSIIIQNEKNDIIWRGTIPKKTLVSNKPYIIILNSITKYIKSKKTKIKNKSFDSEAFPLLDKIISPYKDYINKSFIDSSYKNKNNIKIIKKMNYINIKKRAKNETIIKNYRKETYDRDNSDNNLIRNIYSIINEPSNITPTKPINIKCKLISTDYQICDKIKIKLLENYGHSQYIGLSGIEFYDEMDCLIDMTVFFNFIRINQKMQKNKQKDYLNNLFLHKNNTTEIKNLFLTKKNNVFIEIDFKQKIKVKAIKFYNYNNEMYKNCCTKKVGLIFYLNEKQDKIIKSIYLNKNICEEGIEYGQIIKHPFNNIYNIKRYRNMNNKIKYYLLNNIMIYNKKYDYYCPSYPIGFIIKILFVNNWGNNEYIGLDKIQLFDENNNEIILFKDDLNIELNNNNIEKENNVPDIYLLPENRNINHKIKPLILTRYKDSENKLYIIFDNLIMISKINIFNYDKYDEIAVKDIKIFIDDNLIFEGELIHNKKNQIFFSNSEELIPEKNDIIRKRYSEKILKNGTKIISLV